jgi:hypothetical protein
MQSDDETTATQLSVHPKNCLLVCPRYCQLIRELNKVKRLQWAKECFDNSDNVAVITWRDETCSIGETYFAK